MCGLLALLSANSDAPAFVEPVERALPCMYHRGPDAAAIGTRWLPGDH